MVAQVTLKINKQSSAQVQRKLTQLRKQIKDPTQANRKVSIWLVRWVNENFKSEGGKVGKWKPLKLGGRRVKGKGIDRSAKILQDTGRLRSSFSPFYSRSGAGIGSDIVYASAHEAGIPSRNLPARRMLPESGDRDVSEAIIKIYDFHIRKAIR